MPSLVGLVSFIRRSFACGRVGEQCGCVQLPYSGAALSAHPRARAPDVPCSDEHARSADRVSRQWACRSRCALRTATAERSRAAAASALHSIERTRTPAAGRCLAMCRCATVLASTDGTVVHRVHALAALRTYYTRACGEMHADTLSALSQLGLVLAKLPDRYPAARHGKRTSTRRSCRFAQHCIYCI